MIAANPEKTPAATRSSSAQWLRRVRQLHLYLGVFFAPSILFFAFTGALQLFSLHEGHPGDAWQPPAWIQKLASIHKDQRLGGEHHGPPPPAATPAEARPNFEHHEEHARSKTTMTLKWFFLAMATGLIFTTLLGLYMAFKYERNTALVWSLLLIGAAVPAGLIVAMV